MRKTIQFAVLLFLLITAVMNAAAQTAGIKGVITDSKTKETLVGASVVIQGTTRGVISDLDGNFLLAGLTPGTYNLVVSCISYKPLILEKIKMSNNIMREMNIDLEQNTVALEGVVISSARRTDTEISLLSNMKAENMVVSGISKQLISRSPDRDASEVIRRVPGITIMDDRFVMVRGLSQRYNTVWLNNVSTPSSEPDVRAFSFDMIPSAMIDNIMVFKSPSPELPADFSGVAIKVFTRRNADENSFSVSYSTALRPGTTFGSFRSYSAGKYDWLGFDDGTRALPGGFPAHLAEVNDKIGLQQLGEEFNKIWTPVHTTAIPDQRLQLGLSRRFVAGKISVGTINSLNFSYSQDMDQVFRADYQQYDKINDHSDTNYFFNDSRYKTTAKLGGLSNWTVIFGNNQKIELRQMYNHIGYSQYIDRSGRDNYGGLTIRSRELSFSSRTTYSGQLAGDLNFNSNTSHLNWTLGYAFADRNQPDQKRLQASRVEDPESAYYGQYGVNFSFAATPELSGRVFQHLKENVYTANVNYDHTFSLGSFKPELKTGAYTEVKDRWFQARNIGYAISNFSKFDWSLPYQDVETIFSNENINSTTGIEIDESTNNSDSYTASNHLVAAYVAFKLPLTAKMLLYTGVRMEKNRQQMNSISSNNSNQEVDVDIDKTGFFPSANLSYNFTKKSLVRISYGKTVNRPEFRETAPFAFYDFEMKKLVHGNAGIANAYIHNYDLRFELYPSASETFAAGVFYKRFINPIETIEVNSGSGKDYTFQNALGAKAFGIETEMRKSLAGLSESAGILRFLKHFSVVANASLIRSAIEIDTTVNYAVRSSRPMQGQSPFIVNLGVYYQNDKSSLTVSALYNIIGKRIATVGIELPDVYEMPRHVVDLSLIKNISPKVQVKMTVQDALNQKVVEKQFVSYTNSDGTAVNRDQVTLEYRPGVVVAAGVTVNM